MPPITVDPNDLSGAGNSIGAVGDEIAAAVGTMTSALSGGARSGLDPAGLVFGHAYQQQAQALLDAGAAAANAGRGVGFGVQVSATNYSRADAASTIGGGVAPLAAPDAPAEFSAPASPSALGGGVPPPLLWSVIQTFIPDVWPDGDPSHLRAAGSAWQTFATTINGIAGHLAGPSAVVAGQQIPEGHAMTSAISELTEGLSVIASEAGKLATQTTEFADDVENTQNAIRDLLDRVSPSGFLDGLKAVFSGDALEELKEVADDVKTVLGGYGRQAEARRDVLQIAMGYIDNAVMSVEKWARREFPRFLGDDVGNALATSLDFQLTLRQGILAGAADMAEGLGQLDPLRFAYDPEGAKDTWAGLAQSVGEGMLYSTPTGIAANPAGAFDYWKDRAADAVHSEDWSSDRSGFGLGKVLFDVGLSAIPGGTAARTGKEAADAASGAARSAGRVDAPGSLGALESIGRNADNVTSKLDDLGDFPTSATPNPVGPAIPRELAEPPGAPRVGDAPTPHVATSPTSHAHDSTPVDRTPTPHSSTSPGNPAQGTPSAAPDSRVPAAGDSPSGAHEAASAASNSSVPTSAAPPVASHAPDSPAATGPHPPTSATPDPSPPPEPPLIEPQTDSAPGAATPAHPGSPDGGGPHGPGSGNSGSGHSNSDRPPNPADGPNNPPHTGLHDPPANHSVPGERLPDLTDINNEYRLANGAVDPDRFDQWAEKVSDAYPAITKDGVEGVYNYTTENYQGINPYLRDVDPLSPQQSGILEAPSLSDMTAAQRASWEAQIRQTDEGLAALPPYREDPLDTTSTTWRGMHASDTLLEQLQKGDTFSDPAYLSTTTNQQVAEVFARSAGPDTTPTLVTVVGRDGVDIKDLSRYMDESEVLFPRSTQFEVILREMGPDGLLRITLRQIDP